MTRIIKPLILISILIILSGCGIYKPVDARKIPSEGKERAKKNIAEGRGLSLGGLSDRSTSYEFSTSNPMWRSSLEILDFLPLSTVDYSGGIIITDWYSDGSNQDDSIKITVRFLSNQVQSNSLKITVHRKLCKQQNTSVIQKVDSKIKEELTKSILTKAALLQAADKEKKKKKKK